jgi:hypothetical protein
MRVSDSLTLATPLSLAASKRPSPEALWRQVEGCCAWCISARRQVNMSFSPFWPIQIHCWSFQNGATMFPNVCNTAAGSQTGKKPHFQSNCRTRSLAALSPCALFVNWISLRAALLRCKIEETHSREIWKSALGRIGQARAWNDTFFTRLKLIAT